MKQCPICLKKTNNRLCSKCSGIYIYERKLDGYRLKKRRLKNKSQFSWKTEIRVYKNLRRMFGNAFRNFRPSFAVSPKGALLEYDLCVPSKKILIELDGPYHHDPTLHKCKEDFEYRVLCDRLKEDLAVKNGWKFFRINLEETKATLALLKKICGYKPKIKVFGGRVAWLIKR